MGLAGYPFRKKQGCNPVAGRKPVNIVAGGNDLAGAIGARNDWQRLGRRKLARHYLVVTIVDRGSTEFQQYLAGTRLWSLDIPVVQVFEPPGGQLTDFHRYYSA